MIRIFLTEADKIESDKIFILDSGTLHHLRVLRAEDGERIEVLDGKGSVYMTNLLSFGEHQVVLGIFQKGTLQRRGARFVVACSLISANRFDEVIGKCAEFGIDEIVPMLSRRCIVQMKIGEFKDRWQRKVIEVCKQCGNPYLPRISKVVEFCKFVDGICNERNLVFIPHLEECSQHLLDVLMEKQAELFRYEKVVVLIGPEGDFTPEEVSYALSKAAIPVSLGQMVLRVETAALFCAGIFSYFMGWRKEIER